MDKLGQWMLQLTNIAVLIGVGIVAFELQQTSEALQTDKAVAIEQMYALANEVILSSEGLAEIVVRGDESYASLSEAEQLKYFSYKAIQMNAFETHFSLLIEQEDEEGLVFMVEIAEWLLASDGAKEWWWGPARFNPELEAWIEKNTGIPPSNKSN